MTTDRRVRRTRALLRRAAIEVVREKGFRATRVRDITEAADVNRATFYAHYADKYAFADELVRDEIRHRFAARLPAAPAPTSSAPWQCCCGMIPGRRAAVAATWTSCAR